MAPVSSPGPYATRGLIDEPGCLATSSVARLRPLSVFLSPRPPTSTFTYPVDCSITENDICGCTTKWDSSNVTVPPLAVMASLYVSI